MNKNVERIDSVKLPSDSSPCKKSSDAEFRKRVLVHHQMSLSKHNILVATGLLSACAWLLGLFLYFRDAWSCRPTVYDAILFFAGLIVLIASAFLSAVLYDSTL